MHPDQLEKDIGMLYSWLETALKDTEASVVLYDDLDEADDNCDGIKAYIRLVTEFGSQDKSDLRVLAWSAKLTTPYLPSDKLSEYITRFRLDIAKYNTETGPHGSKKTDEEKRLLLLENLHNSGDPLAKQLALTVTGGKYNNFNAMCSFLFTQAQAEEACEARIQAKRSTTRMNVNLAQRGFEVEDLLPLSRDDFEEVQCEAFQLYLAHVDQVDKGSDPNSFNFLNLPRAVYGTIPGLGIHYL